MSLPCRAVDGAIGCEAAGELLSAWLDDELNAGEAQALDEHLAACASCAAERQRLEEVRAAFRAVPPARPPASLGSAVLERIRREGGRLGHDAGAGSGRRRRLRPGVRALLAAAALLLIAAGGLWWASGAPAVPAEAAAPLAEGSVDALSADLGADAGCGPDGDCVHLAPCDSPAECGGGPPCSNPGECGGGRL